MVVFNGINKSSGGIYNYNGGISVSPSRGPYPGLGFATSEDIRNAGLVTEWFWHPPYGQPRNVNILELRHFAKSVWVKACVNYIKKKVCKTPWTITIKEDWAATHPEDSIKNYADSVRAVKDFLNNPNREAQTFRDVISPWVEDVAIVDAGVWVTPRDEQGRIIELWTRDGGSFLKNSDPRGILADPEKGYYQYSFQNPLAGPIPYPSDYVCYAMMNPQSYTVYGESPVQWLLTVLELLEQGSRFNKEMFRNSNIPDGIVGLVNANHDQTKQFVENWKRNITGKPHKLLFTNSDHKFTPFNISNRDMEWLDGQKFYMHLVFAAFGVTPASLGFVEDSNRANSESQERTTDIAAIEPYLHLIEDKINRAIIPGFLGISSFDLPFEFKFDPKDHVKDRLEKEGDRKDLQAGVLTVNEVREKRGLPPVTWGDQPLEFTRQDRFLQAPSGPFDQGQLSETSPDPIQGEKDGNEGETSEKKPAIKSIGVTKREAQESSLYEGYAQQLQFLLNSAFAELFELVNQELLPQKSLQKDLPTLFQKISMIFSAKRVRILIKPIIEKLFKKGIESVEGELGFDIGFSEKGGIIANRFTDEQVEGYEIQGPGKKRWEGLKGVLRGYEGRVRKIVQDGVNQAKSVKEIAKDIRTLQMESDPTGEGFLNTEAQSRRIARTEVQRLLSAAKLHAYKESGLNLGKKLIGPIDTKTSDLCKRLLSTYKNRVVGLDESFVDAKTGSQFVSTPFHPSCRHTIISEPLKNSTDDSE